MSSAFTHYWSESTSVAEGELLDHTAGNRFVRSGVTTGDRIFCITVRKGIPILIGRMIVSRPPVSFEEASELLPYEPWEAEEHLIAEDGTASVQSLSREIPLPVLQKLRFESPSGKTALKFVSHNRLDQQTFRGVRKLTPMSVQELEALIEDPIDTTSFDFTPTFPDELEEVVYVEGSVRTVKVNAYERDQDARMACIQELGCACFVCGFDFETFYGKLGRGFIHVHHLRPISECHGEYVVDPINDLVPVCPNCHAMLHRGPKPPTVEELAKIFEANVREQPLG